MDGESNNPTFLHDIDGTPFMVGDVVMIVAYGDDQEGVIGTVGVVSQIRVQFADVIYPVLVNDYLLCMPYELRRLTTEDQQHA